MTEQLYLSDSYLQECDAVVLAADDTRIRLDKTIFYLYGGSVGGVYGVDCELNLIAFPHSS